MIKKSNYIILFLLCFFISEYFGNTSSTTSQSLFDTEERIDVTSVVYSFPDPIQEIIYGYQNILFDFPLLPRIKTNIQLTQLLPGGNISEMNKLLLKERFICQSTPKHPYLLQIHRGKAHVGAAKAYYIYALRRLII